MMNVPRETFRQQFKTKHGDDAIWLDGRFLFSDGAWMEHDPMGVSAEPPDDPLERAKLIVRYREARLGQAEDQFREMKSGLLMTAQIVQRQGGPLPDDQKIAELERLQKVVRQQRKKLREAREEVEKNIPERVRQLEAYKAREERENARFVAKVQGIKV